MSWELLAVIGGVIAVWAIAGYFGLTGATGGS
jgi:hypothetical protein